MTEAGSAIGLGMLLVLGVATAITGAPVWMLLVGVASVFAASGVALGVMDVSVLSAVSYRVLGLLDNDLLQALPLYVLMGVLLDRMRFAEAIFASFARVAHRVGAGPSLATLGVGLLVSPMNGSVASSATLLSKIAGQRLEGSNVAHQVAWIGIGATVGVVVPPSLVLILMGDAMMRAHTEATKLAQASLGAQRIINTQDLFHAALVPGFLLVVLWGVMAAVQGRDRRNQAAPVARADQWVALGSVLSVVALLYGVYSGHVLAVEAAAAGGVLLILAAVGGKLLGWNEWHEVLDQTLGLSGALLSLLMGATVFSLVFRLYGTDVWLSHAILNSSLPAVATAGLVLLLVGLCAATLDAFEMIFVIVPVAAPPLVVLLQDAQQVAVLLLLVLQLSFLLPPMGYAVMLARQWAAAPTTLLSLSRALAPYLAIQIVVMGLVFVYAPMVHWLDAPAVAQAQLSDGDIDAQMRAMSEIPVDVEELDKVKPGSKNP